MRFRRIIALCALLGLLAGQGALARHSAVHPDHGQGSIAYAQSAHADQEQSGSDLLPDGQKPLSHTDCPEYLLGKTLHSALLADAGIIPVVQPAGETITLAVHAAGSSFSRLAHHPRAPPAFLI